MAAATGRLRKKGSDKKSEPFFCPSGTTNIPDAMGKCKTDEIFPRLLIQKIPGMIISDITVTVRFNYDLSMEEFKATGCDFLEADCFRSCGKA